MLGVAANALAQEELVITGTVTDANGEPIIGANISRKDDPGLGAITNYEGKYKITAKQYQTLVFTYIGFKKVEEREIEVDGETHMFNVFIGDLGERHPKSKGEVVDHYAPHQEIIEV